MPRRRDVLGGAALILSHDQGCFLLIWAQPGARRNGIQGEYRGALKVTVAAPPEDGRANTAIIEVVCQALELRRSQVSLVSGQTGREKRLQIDGITANDLRQRIAAHLSLPVKNRKLK